MAAKDVRGVWKNYYKKQTSCVAFTLNKDSFDETTFNATVSSLPNNVYIKDVFLEVKTTAVGATNIDVGWSSDTDAIANDLAVSGAAGTIVSSGITFPVSTGDFGQDIVVTCDAKMTAGEIVLVIELVEPENDIGDNTKLPNPHKI